MVITKTQQTAEEKARDLGPGRGRLKDEIAIVTGADSGIGQAVAIAFAKEGADVAIPVHRDREGTESTRHFVEAEGRRCAVADLDQCEPESVKRFFEHARRELGTPTILVNNAGLPAEGKRVADMTDEEWDDVIRTDLYGPFYFCREFIRVFEEANLTETPASELSGDVSPQEWTKGVIINNTSVHQEIPMPRSAAYDAAKGGLRNLTRTLAVEVAESRIRVVNVAPGMTLTPFNQEAIDNPDVRAERVRNIPMRRAALPDEIARAVVFLASDEASYVHGSTLTVDGGLERNVGQGA